MKHPAVFSDPILDVMARELDERLALKRAPRFVLDPFAGTGKVHDLVALCDVEIETFGIELMPKWAAMHPRTWRGDATDLPYEARQFAAAATSVCYGNRMADHHKAGDKCSECKGSGVVLASSSVYGKDAACGKCGGSGLSPRRSYCHDYGDGFFTDAPIEKNAGAMHWGDAYRELHEAAHREVHRVLRRGGVYLLNVKNHMKDDEVVRVAEWHRDTCKAIGFEYDLRVKIPLLGNGFGANRDARVDHEVVYVMSKR